MFNYNLKYIYFQKLLLIISTEIFFVETNEIFLNFLLIIIVYFFS